MRGGRLLLILSMLMSCSGCVVVSLHPLWSQDVHAEDQSLEGAWVEFDRVFERDGTPWVVTAQHYPKDRDFTSGWCAELVCDATFDAAGNMTCITKPVFAIIPPTYGGKCEGNIGNLNLKLWGA